MSDRQNSIRVPGPVVTTVLGVLLTAAISFNAWAVGAVYTRPTETRVRELIDDKTQYTVEVLKELKKSNDELRQAILAHTAKIAEMNAMLKDR